MKTREFRTTEKVIMPSSSAKVAEMKAYNAVRATLFTRIHRLPTQNDYELLKKEASDLASEVENITFTWSCDTVTGDEYGLLVEIIGPAEYTHLTNLNWVLFCVYLEAFSSWNATSRHTAHVASPWSFSIETNF
jgi:hypothetical protein